MSEYSKDTQKQSQQSKSAAQTIGLQRRYIWREGRSKTSKNSKYPVSGPTFEQGTSQSQNRSVNHSTGTLDTTVNKNNCCLCSEVKETNVTGRLPTKAGSTHALPLPYKGKHIGCVHICRRNVLGSNSTVTVQNTNSKTAAEGWFQRKNNSSSVVVKSVSN
jgi:hypothetical protein